MHRKTTMAVLAVAVALLGVVAIVQTGGGVDEVDATDAGTDTDLTNAFTNGGNYTLTANITISGGTVSQDLVLDLNGQTLTSTATITIGEGVKLTIKDSTDANGTIYSNTESISLISVSKGGTLVVESGTIELASSTVGSNTIVSYGTVDVNGGTFKRSTLESNASTYVFRANDGTLSIDNAEIDSEANAVGVGEYNKELKTGTFTHATITDSIIDAGAYGAVVFGIGNQRDNSSITLAITDTTINAKVCIGTNASSGVHAGFTIDISDSTLTATGAGFYAPGYGIYNINGGSISAPQGIRISAGVMTIEGGATITCNQISNPEAGIYQNGPGGANAAIVAGKASNGYVGDLIINVNGANLLNNNEGDAVIVTNNVMGLDAFSGNEFKFNFNSGNIEGDVRNITSKVYKTDTTTGGLVVVTTGIDSSGQNVNVNLNGGIMDGRFYQNTEAAANLNGTTILGDVEQTSGDGKEGVEFNGSSVFGSVLVDEEELQPEGIVTLVIIDVSMPLSYYGTSFILPILGDTLASAFEGYTFIGWSTSPNASVAEYSDGEKIENASGNYTLYAVLISDEPVSPPSGWDDDEDLPPFIPTQPAEEDDTVTIVACAAAAAVAAILAVFLVIDRKG